MLEGNYYELNNGIKSDNKRFNQMEFEAINKKIDDIQKSIFDTSELKFESIEELKLMIVEM